jgi:hypothetical protein
LALRQDARVERDVPIALWDTLLPEGFGSRTVGVAQRDGDIALHLDPHK